MFFEFMSNDRDMTKTAKFKFIREENGQKYMHFVEKGKSFKV